MQQGIPDATGKRRRLQDQKVTAPDAVADGEDEVERIPSGASPGISHVHIEETNNRPKRTATQAKLRDFFRSKRSRLE